LSTQKIEKEIGWKARVKFEEGIEKTVSWYLKNLDWALKKVDYLRDYWEKVYKK